MPTYEVISTRRVTRGADWTYQAENGRFEDVYRGRSLHRDSWHPPTEDEQYCDSMREWLCAHTAAFLERKAEKYRSRSHTRSRSRSRSGSRRRYGMKLKRPCISYFDDPAALPPYTPRLPAVANYRGSSRRHSPCMLLPGPDTVAKNTPKVHLLSYSYDAAPTRSKAHRLMDHYLDPKIKHLYTILATDFDVPPRHICEKYTGTSPQVQDYVMRDPRAHKAVCIAVEDVIAHLSPPHRRLDDVDRSKRHVRFLDDNGKNERHRREDHGAEPGKGKGRLEVAISTTCYAGTHRSVTLVEMIAKRLGVEANKGVFGKQGLEVRVKHIHRRKTPLDPY